MGPISGRYDRGLNLGASPLIGLVVVASLTAGGWAFRQEQCVLDAAVQIDRIKQAQVYQSGDGGSLTECGKLPPMRARLLYASALAEEARLKAPGKQREAMLRQAQTHVDAALQVNSGSADALMFDAFLATLRSSPDDRRADAQLIASYRRARYLPAASGWRAGYAMRWWNRMPLDVQRSAVDEAVSLARINPDRRPQIFSWARSTDAYASIMLRWHSVRMTDKDRLASARTP